MRNCVAVVVVAIAACKSSDTKPPEPTRVERVVATDAPAEQPVELGQLKRQPQALMFGVIAPAGVKLAALEKLAKDKATSLKLTIDLEQSTAAKLDINRDAARYMMGGVPATDFDAIERGGALMFASKAPSGAAELRAMSTLVAAVADTAHGWVVDPSVGGLFTAAAFHDRIPGATLDTRKLIAVHAVGGEEEQPFLDTMGMARLGLPELYLAAAAPGQVDALTILINATAQTLLVRGDITRRGELDVDLAHLDGSWHLDATQKAGGTGKITWRVRWTRSGDHNDGELALELVPTLGSGVEGIAKTLDTFFGDVPDPIVQVAADDPEILAAAKRARKELGALRTHFAKGIPPDEQLLVKAPFRAADGYIEWMWVDVIKWRRDELSGTLDSDPDVVKSLHQGSQVTVKLSDVADYLIMKADGTSTGGLSIEILRKRGAIP